MSIAFLIFTLWTALSASPALADPDSDPVVSGSAPSETQTQAGTTPRSTPSSTDVDAPTHSPDAGVSTPPPQPPAVDPQPAPKPPAVDPHPAPASTTTKQSTDGHTVSTSPPKPIAATPVPDTLLDSAPTPPEPKTRPDQVPPSVQQTNRVNNSYSLLPQIPKFGFGMVLLCLLVSLLVSGVQLGLTRWRTRLAPVGWIPNHIGAAIKALRFTAYAAAGLATFALLPRSLDPLLFVVLVVLAIAAGWSFRDTFKDLMAGIVIKSERNIRPGLHISIQEIHGIVQRIGLRSSEIRNAHNQMITIPNRALLDQSVVTDAHPWPAVDVLLHIPESESVRQIHQLLEHAVLCSPWAAPAPLEMIQVEETPTKWRIRARVLELRFRDSFAGTLREQVDEAFEAKNNKNHSSLIEN